MAKVCSLCGKGAQFGHNVSHAHNITNRRFNPNLQNVRVDDGNGNGRQMKVCTRCLRSGKITKKV